MILWRSKRAPSIRWFTLKRMASINTEGEIDVGLLFKKTTTTLSIEIEMEYAAVVKP